MKKVVAALSAFAFAGSALAFMPQAGIWSISPERNGQPGRGFNLDVQNNTLVMQMYGYEKSGAPTFYLSAGQISNNAFTGQLFQYAGGRYMGGPAQSAHETGSAGTVKMRFVSGIKGYITFPGEEEKEIVRYTFAYEEMPESLIGFWGYMSLESSGTVLNSLVIPLSVVSGKAAASADGRIGCQFTGAAKGEVMCVWIEGGKATFGTIFTLSVNDGEGWAGATVNNLTDMVTVRRLTTPGGMPAGLVIPKKSASAARFPALENALDEAIAELNR